MTATMTREKVDQSAAFKMPEATVCMPVLWYMDGHPTTRPFAAFVTGFGGRTVDLVVYAPNGGRKTPMGVRHVSDPLATQTELSDTGAWDYTEETKRLRRLEISVGQLMGVLDDSASK